MTNRVLRRGHIAVVTRERPDGKSNSFPLYVASARTDTESRFTLTARVTLTAQNIPEHKPAEQFGLNVGRQGLFMNYREWLLYRAAKYQPEATEPEVQQPFSIIHK